eukprot:4922207-Prymnesium_polylepis.1
MPRRPMYKAQGGLPAKVGLVRMGGIAVSGGGQPRRTGFHHVVGVVRLHHHWRADEPGAAPHQARAQEWAGPQRDQLRPLRIVMRRSCEGIALAISAPRRYLGWKRARPRLLHHLQREARETIKDPLRYWYCFV